MLTLHNSRKARVSFPDNSSVTFDIGIASATVDSEEMFTHHNPMAFEEDEGHVLYDEESRLLLTEHKKFLYRLVSAKHKELQSMGFHHMNNSSLRSIISERLDRSSMSLQKLEADITDATEDLTDFSEHPFDGHLTLDFDEQVQALEMFHNSCSRRGSGRSHNDDMLAYERSSNNDDDDEDEEDDDDSFSLSPMHAFSASQWAVPPTNRKIPISAELSVPLRGAAETWNAIRTAATTAVTCKGCHANLHVLEDAEYVVCPDCWTVGPVEYKIGGIMLESDGSSGSFGLALGVKADEVLEWVEEANSKQKSIG